MCRRDFLYSATEKWGLREYGQMFEQWKRYYEERLDKKSGRSAIC